MQTMFSFFIISVVFNISFEMSETKNIIFIFIFMKTLLLFLCYSGAQKKTPCEKKDPCEKVNPCAKKMSLGEKNLFVKKFIFFVDKLKMIDFNIFNILKLIFTCESVAYLLQNSFVNVSFNLTLFFLVFYFDCLFEDWSVVCLLCFVLSLLDTLFYSLPWDKS